MKNMIKKKIAKPVNERKGELELRDEWLKEAREQTPETIGNFIKHLANDYRHDYGTIVRATAAAAVAAAWSVQNSKQGGLTGFQAGYVKWDFMRGWDGYAFDIGMRILNYENMLYPQYADKFEKTITDKTWEALQKKAKELLDDPRNENAHPTVRKHWESIVSGNIPFGYKIEKGE